MATDKTTTATDNWPNQSQLRKFNFNILMITIGRLSLTNLTNTLRDRRQTWIHPILSHIFTFQHLQQTRTQNSRKDDPFTARKIMEELMNREAVENGCGIVIKSSYKQRDGRQVVHYKCDRRGVDRNCHELVEYRGSKGESQCTYWMPFKRCWTRSQRQSYASRLNGITEEHKAFTLTLSSNTCSVLSLATSIKASRPPLGHPIQFTLASRSLKRRKLLDSFSPIWKLGRFNPSCESKASNWNV